MHFEARHTRPRTHPLSPSLQAKAGLKFERVGAPQPADMAQVAADRSVESVAAVDASVLPFFRAAAAKLVESVGSAEDALAMALAKLTGHVELRPRSLLTAHEDFTTLQFVSPWPVEKPGQVRARARWLAAGAGPGSKRSAGCVATCVSQPPACLPPHTRSLMPLPLLLLRRSLASCASTFTRRPPWRRPSA